MDKVREGFLEAIRDTAEYWAKQPGDKQHVCNGTAFSILVLLDGYSSHNFNGFAVREKRGSSEGPNISGRLHDDFYQKPKNEKKNSEEEM